MSSNFTPVSPKSTNKTVLYVIVWIVLRILTSTWVAILSPLSPLTQIENRMPVWPPTQPIDNWLNRILLTPWIRWDSRWYITIITQGYHSGDGTTSFHPLYPWLGGLLTWAGISSILSLLIIGSLATLLFMFVFARLSEDESGDKEGHYSVLLFLFYPMAFILFAPYTEALFLLCSASCFYFLIKKKWILAGLMGMLATLTRQQGIFLSIPIFWEIWRDSNQSIQKLTKHWRGWLATCLPPLGMLFWIIYRGLAFQDAKPDFHSFNGIIYSIFISSSAERVIPKTSFTWPWLALWNALTAAWNKPDIDLMTNLTLGILFLILLGLTWRRMRMSFRLYSLTIALISFSYQTGSIHPYMGLPRHLFLALPIFITLNSLIKKSWQRLLWSALGLSGMLYLLLNYVFESWVP